MRTRLEGRTSRLERGIGRRACGCEHRLGVRFEHPPSEAELAAVPEALRPRPERCPRCGRAAAAVYVLPTLDTWTALMDLEPARPVSIPMPPT